jgi:sulfur carrier protein
VITVNGQPREFPDGTAVAAVVAELIGPGGTGTGRGLAVAVNGEVVPRTSWETSTVAAGDRVEVLTATQGG